MLLECFFNVMFNDGHPRGVGWLFRFPDGQLIGQSRIALPTLHTDGRAGRNKGREFRQLSEVRFTGFAEATFGFLLTSYWSPFVRAGQRTLA